MRKRDEGGEGKRSLRHMLQYIMGIALDLFSSLFRDKQLFSLAINLCVEPIDIEGEIN